MGVFDFVRNGVRELMVARPDGQKHLIVYKHPVCPGAGCGAAATGAPAAPGV